MPMYFDNSATTQVAFEVYQAMIPYFTERYANPSSVHTLGTQACLELDNFRKIIAEFLNAAHKENIVFTGSGTEADNIAIIGSARALLDKGRHIITTNIEHKAILESCKYLEGCGFRVTYLKPKKDGVISVQDFEEAITDDTIMASIMYVNNELGTIQPIKEIGKITKARGIYLHTDAVQAAGKIKLDVKDLNVDMLSISGHKIYAPKGIGVLYLSDELKDIVKPVLFGGKQEFGLRPGTENIPYIAGMAKACEIISSTLDEEVEHIRSLRDMFEAKLLAELDDVYINGNIDKRVCSLSNISFSGIEAEALMIYSSEICCSTGSACSSGVEGASHVLQAIDIDPISLHGTIRYSFGRYNTRHEVEEALEIIINSVKKLQSMSPLLDRKQAR